jgi:hypothetical protein
MTVLVCGSRVWRDGPTIRARLKQLPRGTTIIHGGCRGADICAGAVARSLGLAVKEYPADWKGLGRSAGVRRNLAMLDQKPDLVLAFQIHGSTGTQHTIDEARKRGIPVEVVTA